MKLAIFAWFLILILMTIYLLTGKVPFWVPIILWLVVVLIRAKEKIGNYLDAEKKNVRDEKLQLNQKAEEMAGRGLASSGFRNQAEQRIREDFEFDRRKSKRKLWVDLVGTLFLK